MPSVGVLPTLFVRLLEPHFVAGSSARSHRRQFDARWGSGDSLHTGASVAGFVAVVVVALVGSAADETQLDSDLSSQIPPNLRIGRSIPDDKPTS